MLNLICLGSWSQNRLGEQTGKQSGCESLVLTHFSQRYPKVPELGDVLHGKTGIAFDLMSLALSDIDLPAAVLPFLRELFHGDEGQHDLTEDVLEYELARDCL
jgi:hypothetical protein